MERQLTKLITMLKLWLEKNSLDGDAFFYTIQEWRERGEQYLNDSEFVIVTEGGLNHMLNWGDSEEFYELVESFGYYCEMGHSWNIGFYKDIWANNDNKPNRSYREKLQDARWIRKRDFVRKRAEYKCEDCGSLMNLQVHHCYYMFDFEPWEYPLDALRCLCESCHLTRANTERILRSHLASLKTDELSAFVEFIENGLYWYPKEEVFKLLKSFRHDQTEMIQLFNQILQLRTNNSL